MNEKRNESLKRLEEQKRKARGVNKEELLKEIEDLKISINKIVDYSIKSSYLSDLKRLEKSIQFGDTSKTVKDKISKMSQRVKEKLRDTTRR